MPGLVLVEKKYTTKQRTVGIECRTDPFTEYEQMSISGVSTLRLGLRVLPSGKVNPPLGPSYGRRRFLADMTR